MKVERITIKRYRSITEAELPNCGGFNVLIGKNNSGKSNVLSAISSFFACMTDGSVVTLNPPIGREVDFFDKSLSRNIEVTVLFSLALAERDALIRDVVSEVPQVKNAIDGLDPTLNLAATIDVVPPPSSFAYVSRLSLVEPSHVPTRALASERVLFDLSLDSAKELYAKLRDVQQSSEDAVAITNVLPEVRPYAEQAFVARSDREGKMPPEYLLNILSSRSGAKLSPSVVRELQEMVGRSVSYEEFSRSAHNLIDRLKEEALRIQNEPLRNKVVTFSGEGAAIPSYVRNLISAIYGLRLLYLRERRKQIGREEAARLLSLKVTRGGPQVYLSSEKGTI